MKKSNKERMASAEDEGFQPSRRDFARNVALATVTAALLPTQALAVEMADPQGKEKTPAEKTATPDASAQKPVELSPAARAEAEARADLIFREYGDRLSAEEKADIRRLLLEGQKQVEEMRAYALTNGDEPLFKLQPVHRER